MAWDAAKPAGSQKIRLSDEEIRANQAAVEDALNREHSFPGTMGSTAGQHKFPVEAALPSGAEGRLSIHNNLLHWYSNGAWRTLIPAGTKMLFLQAAAPVGWTQDAALNDRVLRVVSSAGAGTGGNWTLAGMAVGGHVLTVAEMPAHTHPLNSAAPGVQPGAWYYTWATPGEGGSATGSTGGGQAHAHDLANADWRPAYVDVIACTKD